MSDQAVARLSKHVQKIHALLAKATNSYIWFSTKSSRVFWGVVRASDRISNGHRAQAAITFLLLYIIIN